MSTPRYEADVDVLSDMGITTLLTLTLEQPLEPAWFYLKPIQNIHVPLENYGLPTIAEMDLIYTHFNADTDGAWLIHCGGGKGRAGTVLACLMAMLGYSDDGIPIRTPRMDKTTAIQTIRAIRPGSIESDRQEDFVGQWISHRWAVQTAPDNEAEPVSELEILKAPGMPDVNHANVQYCFLVGLPGSGKTWLARSIAKRRSDQTVIISQDDTGSRRVCENALGQHYPVNTLVIFDCCNSNKAHRKYMLSLITAVDAVMIGVHFDYPRQVCQQRIDARLGHPTLRAGNGRYAVDHMSAHYAHPDLAEGFHAVLIVSSFHASRQAAHLLGGPTQIIKFPRTPHIIDLGSSTADDIVHELQDMTGRLVIEEKIDGANMGISLDWEGQLVVQNRSHYICATDHAQFKPLTKWLEHYRSDLTSLLGRDSQYPERFILYGEWMVARHSIYYTHLPGHFIAFDLYDRVKRAFVSRRILSSALKSCGIPQVPLLKTVEYIAREDLRALVHTQSALYNGKVEGVYVRTESEDGMRTLARGKVVREDFISGDEHWSRGPLTLNSVVQSEI